MTFPQRSKGVGIIEGDATLLKVKAHTEPRRQRVGEARGRGGPVGDGVSGTVPMATVVVIVVLGQVDLTHPHSEETERRSRVQGVLCAAVMTAVRVVAGQREREKTIIMLGVALFYPLKCKSDMSIMRISLFEGFANVHM